MNEETIANWMHNLSESIICVAWLSVQYEGARMAIARSGRFLTRKEFMEKPAYTIALQPMGLMAVIRAGIPHAMVVVQQQSQPKPNLLGANGKSLVI